MAGVMVSAIASHADRQGSNPSSGEYLNLAYLETI